MKNRKVSNICQFTTDRHEGILTKDDLEYIYMCDSNVSNRNLNMNHIFCTELVVGNYYYQRHETTDDFMKFRLLTMGLIEA